jgi:ribonuclease G
MRALIDTWRELQEKLQEGTAPCRVHEEPGLVEQVVRDWLTEDVDRIVVDSRERYEQTKKSARAFGRRISSRIQLYEGDAPVFEHFEVERQMEEALRRKVDLPSGGHIVFEETEALIAIDVNTARHKAKSHEEAILEVNIEAVAEVARQLRLRNVGGLVMIDLVDMRSRKHQNLVYRDFRDALKKDKARTNALPISKLGILEMSRQRVDESMQASMYVDCPYCRGRGDVRSAFSMSVEVQRQISAVMRKQRGAKEGKALQIVVHPLVLERLKLKDEKILIALQSEFDGHLSFKGDPAMHRDGFCIRDTESGEVLHATVEKET